MSARTKDIKVYNPVFDLIRGLASMLIFICHMKPMLYAMMGLNVKSYYPYAPLDALAFFSVEIFFAISGALLGPILYNHFKKDDIRKNLSIFVKRRWYRTFPSYYLGIIVFAISYYLAGSDIPDIWPLYLIFMQYSFESGLHFFGTSWSLAVEEVFYVVFPLGVFLIWYFWRKPAGAFLTTLICIIVFSFLTRCLAMQDFYHWDDEIRRLTFLRLDAIAFGALIGIFYKNVSRAFFILASICMVTTISYLIMNWNDIINTLNNVIILQLIFIFLPLSCAVFVQYCANNLKLKGNKMITFIADISYPLYVFHVPIAYMMFPDGSVATPTKLVIYIWFTIGFSYLVFKYIETPILKRRPKYD